MHRGRGYVQVSGADTGPVRRKLDRGPQEYQEGASILGSFRQVTAEGGGGAFCFSTFLSGSIAGSVTIWGGYLGDVGGNDQNVVGVSRGFPPEGDGQDVKPTVRRYLEQKDGGDFP